MNHPQLVLADLDEIVFEGREKAYGAYQIRKNQDRILERAALVTFMLFISLTALPKMIDWISPKEAVFTVTEVEFPPLEDVLPLDEDIEKPEELTVKEAEMPKQPDINQTRFVQVTPSPDADPDATIADVAQLDTTAIGKFDNKGSGGGEITIDDKNPFDGGGGGLPELPKDTVPDYRAFVPLDKEPQPVNLDELRKMIGYPKLALEAEIEGKVNLRVFVDKNGVYQKHVVTNVAHKLLVDAVVSKIHHLRMTPGVQGNKAIPVWVTVPFEFKLQKNRTR